MGRESIARSAQLLYVGRTDAEFEKVWEQYRHEGQAVEQASTPQQALEALESVAARVVIINLLGEGLRPIACDVPSRAESPWCVAWYWQIIGYH